METGHDSVFQHGNITEYLNKSTHFPDLNLREKSWDYLKRRPRDKWHSSWVLLSREMFEVLINPVLMAE